MTRVHRIEIHRRPDAPGHDPLAERIAQALAEAAPITVRTATLYFIAGPIAQDERQLAELATALLADPVLDEVQLTTRAAAHSIEVTSRPGVSDRVAHSLLDAARRLGFAVEQAATGLRVELHAAQPLPRAVLEGLARSLLANEIVQVFAVDAPVAPPFVALHGPCDRVERFALATLDDDGLLALSCARRLALDLDEMRAIQRHFAALGRDATDLELETLAQTWSEHCVHKTFRASIDYTELAADGTCVHREALPHGLLTDALEAATHRLARPWVVSAFADNAGIVRLDERYELAVKVETHNRPSALEPFGGASTGVGGVLRDILGVSARPFANLDVLCFGPRELPDHALPEGVLPPERVREGVIAGIEDYGNKMGIPTVAGAVVHDPGYVANPLVFCGSVGILPRGAHPRTPSPGDAVVVLGARTGRDGLRGATFSSMGLDAHTALVAGSAVQIGHPIHEKQLLEVVLRARDARLYSAITDCGAGGLSSAIGELAAGLGAEVELAHVPLKYDGLAPWEIWLSESQERMVLAVPAEHCAALQALAARFGVEASVLGHFTDCGTLSVRLHGVPLASLPLDVLHGGRPPRHLVARWRPPALLGARQPLPACDAGALLEALLAGELTSRADIVRRYDHEVQGGTVGRPLVGPGDGPGDGSVVVPLELREQWRPGEPLLGVAIGIGLDPHAGQLDPAVMAWRAIDEALRNLVAVGADPRRVALVDNFCWGDPRDPETLGALVRCVLACRDAALAYGTPFVSGKDSLNNVYTAPDGSRRAIPGTLVVTAVGLVRDVARRVDSALTTPGHALWLVGATRGELGASALARRLGLARGDLPPPRCALVELVAVHQAITDGHVSACHDLSEGGLAVALAEMALGGQLGADVSLDAVPRTDDAPLAPLALLFAETSGRFLLEVPPEHEEALAVVLAEVPAARIGTVTAERRLRVVDARGTHHLDVALRPARTSA